MSAEQRHLSRWLSGFWWRLVDIVAFSDTRPTRLFLATVNVLFAVYMTSDVAADDMQVMNQWLPTGHLIVALFLINGAALLVGLVGRHNMFTFLLEGLLGWTLWAFAATTNWLAQGVPGPSLAVSLAMTWVLVRYPTHWVFRRKRRGAESG